jgi:uncharacterized protein YraI
MGTRKLRRHTVTLVAGVGAVAGLLVGVPASPAAAAGGVVGKVTTNGTLLNVRTGPSTAEARTGFVPHGRGVTIMCQTSGDKIRGNVRTTRLWDRLADGTYVSDAYITRPKTALPSCARLDAGTSVGQVQPPATHGPEVSASGWTLPIPGGVGSGYRTKDRPTHDGIDVGAVKGTPIRATAAGTVITAECNASTKNCDVDGSLKVGGCGWYVEIQHPGKVVTRYCHMVKRPSVAVGDKVTAGQIKGYVGSYGNSSGPHLHFEVHTSAAPALRTNAVEPVAFLKTKGVIVR